MASTVALIDYGAGNLQSVHNALIAAGANDVRVTADAGEVLAADRIVLPGVGAFAAAMERLSAIPDMIPALNRAVKEDSRPFLGICVGMQLMAAKGEEHGDTAGLGWVPGTVAAMKPKPDIRIPHMGWNDVSPATPHPLIEPGEAYFLHGFAYRPVDGDNSVLAITDHGGPVVAAIAAGSAVGVQFHPEKSQGYGLATLKRFLEWRP